MQKFKTAIMATLVCFAAFTQPLQNAFGHASVTPSTTVNCDKPTAAFTGKGAGYFTFAVQANSGSLKYSYENKSTGNVSGVFSTGNGTLTVDNLPPGTYKFYFWSVCGMVESEPIIIDDLITW